MHVKPLGPPHSPVSSTGIVQRTICSEMRKNNVVRSTHMTAGSWATCQGVAPDRLSSQLSSNFTRLQWLKISYRSGFSLFTCCFLSCSHLTCVPVYYPKQFINTCVIHTKTLKSNTPVALLSTEGMKARGT